MPGPFSDEVNTLDFLRGFSDDPIAMARLRTVATEGTWATARSKGNDHETLRQLAHQLEAGQFCLIPHERLTRTGYVGGDGAASATVEPPRVEPSTEPAPGPHYDPELPLPTYGESAVGGDSAALPEPEAPVPTPVPIPWIEFQVVHHGTREPVADATLRLRMPDGAVGTYTTDADGIVHLADCPAGPCDLEVVLDEVEAEVVAFE